MPDQKRHTKVTRFRILKPAGDMTWKALAKMLRDTRYRVFRLANLTVSEAYLNFHLFRTGRVDEFKTATIGQLNRRLREMLADEEVSAEALDRFSRTGALPDTVVSALSQYKIGSITAKSKWREVVRGKSALPTFRGNMAIPIRCDKSGHRRLQRTESGDVELDLMVCLRPYPRVVLQTGAIGGGAKAILDRLLENSEQSDDGYRQRCFEVKHDDRSKKWWLYVTYDFPATERPGLSKEIIVGVDVGYSCPIFVAINNGHARLGRRQFAALGARIKSLQTQVMARRRSVQRGGRASLSQETARSGHGRKRKLRATEKLQGRINDSYTTLNHQLSKSVVDFALNHGAGVIQVENLEGLKEQLTGTFLGARWRYHELMKFIEYKANEAGVKFRAVNPKYTSRRCSACGVINFAFDRAARDAMSTKGKVARFVCPECKSEADPDYNAARNLATLDIEALIAKQCNAQGVD